MEFKTVTKIPQAELTPYLRAQCLHISDFSRGFLFMWNAALKPEYAIVAGCLVLREYYAGKCYFHYPISLTGSREEERAAIKALETDCRDRGERLHFTNIPESRIADMVCRYDEASLTNNRRWRDYLYFAEDFKQYPGKKYAGQRNHARKFAATFPEWTFSEVLPSDMGAVKELLAEYEQTQRSKHTFLAEEEMDEVYDLLPHLGELGLFAGVLRVNGKAVGFSVGERCGDTVVVHIEKALREYEGAYPFLAQQFARTFCTEGAVYLNRMDDAGDGGLRKSKLQYRPCELVGKYSLTPKRAIDGVNALPTIRTERLVLRPVADADAGRYARLASDEERNRFWGYDWRESFSGGTMPEDMWFVSSAREDFHHRMEMPLGVYFGDEFIGEAVLHRFGYAAEAEVGVRLLAEYEGNGFAREAVRAYAEFGLLKLGLERIEAKCFRENERSHRMLLAAGMRPAGEDATFFYFEQTAAM